MVAGATLDVVDRYIEGRRDEELDTHPRRAVPAPPRGRSTLLPMATASGFPWRAPMNDDQAGRTMARTVKRARAALVAAVATRMSTGQPGGLRATHLQVFEHLDRAGIRLTTLAQRAHMSHQAMSELVGELVDNGYLERVPDPVDGRARLVRPTPRGLRELHRAEQVLCDICAQWQRELGEVSVDQILRGLQVLIGVCEVRPPEGP